MTQGAWYLLAVAALLAAGCGSDAPTTAFQAGAGGERATGGAPNTAGQAHAGDTSTGGERPSSGGGSGAGGATPSGGSPSNAGGADSEVGGSSSGGATSAGAGGDVDSGPIGTGGRPSVDEDSGAPRDDSGAGGSVGCECTSGPCCDGCSFRPFGFLCSKDEVYESACVQGTPVEQRACPALPFRMRLEHQNVFCSGDAAACSGRAVHSKESFPPCQNGSYCHEDSDAAISAACRPGCES